MAAHMVSLPPLDLKTANLNRFERAMTDPRWQTGAVGRAFAAASQSARSQLQQTDPHVDALTTVATSVAAPLVTAYVQWVLTQAARHGITRLYFLAREGQIMYRVAKMFQARWQLPVHLQYLFCSRKSLNHVLLSTVSPDDMRWALTHAQGHSLRRLLSRLSLCPEDLGELLNTAGFTASRWDVPLDSKDQERVIALLLGSDVAPLIEAKAKAARALLEDYLAQVQFFDDSLCGVVDSGGMGSQIRTLDKIKRTRGGHGVRGFVIWRTGDPLLAAGDGPVIDTYCRDATCHGAHQSLKGLWQLSEVFCAADHGEVVGYERHDAQVRPVLQMNRRARIREWGIDRVQLSICTATEAVLSTPISPELFDQVDLSPLVQALMGLLWHAPTRDEAAAWGAFPWEHDATAAEIPLGPPVGWRDLLTIVRRAPWQDPIWWAASETRSPAYIRAILRVGRLAPRPVRRVLRGRAE